jgi:hypothetical protein
MPGRESKLFGTRYWLPPNPICLRLRSPGMPRPSPCPSPSRRGLAHAQSPRSTLVCVACPKQQIGIVAYQLFYERNPVELLNRAVATAHSNGCRMNLTDEFLKHAADCEQMAKFTLDPASKVTWNEMAERFHRCAAKFTSQSLVTRNAILTKRHRNHGSRLAEH